MHRIYASFNDETEDGAYFVLYFRNYEGFSERNVEPYSFGFRLDDPKLPINLSEGMVVTIYDDEDDIEVDAVLMKRVVSGYKEGSPVWIAVPDWSTRKEFGGNDPIAP
jgi:hypothetical protein